MSERIKFSLECQEKKGIGLCPRLSTCQRMWDLGEKVTGTDVCGGGRKQDE